MPITTEDYEVLVNTINQDWGKVKGSPQRLAILMGIKGKAKAVAPSSRDRSRYNMKKYEFLLNAPFKISEKCCHIMKKAPTKRYSRETGKKPILATMACESELRTQKWLEHGCNAFDLKTPTSTPMSFWTEQDVLEYIKKNNIEICSVYGDIVADDKNGADGQMQLADISDEFDSVKLKTTGCARTGCMFCGYGCHLEKGEGRFARMKRTHPKVYDYLMRPKEKGGLDYKNIIDWLNEHGNLKIKY